MSLYCHCFKFETKEYACRGAQRAKAGCSSATDKYRLLAIALTKQ